MKKASQHIEFKLFYKIMMLDRLLNDGIIERETIQKKAVLKKQGEEIAKLIFTNLTEEDKKIFLKSLTAVHKILKKAT